MNQNNQDISSDVTPDLAQNLQAALDSSVDNTGIPGASVAVITPDGQWYSSSGVSDLETQRAVKSDDLFKIGSISKTFTGVSILKLVEEGKLQLTDTLDKWLPDSLIGNIPNTEDITIEQLLNHTSGIFNYTGLKFAADEVAYQNGADIDWSRESIINNYVVGENPSFAPGESFEYSNTNYLLLGMIIESATGNSYQEEVTRSILQPLGLENTYFVPDEAPGERFVTGYGDRIGADGKLGSDGVLEDTRNGFPSLAISLSDGGIISNAKDVARFGDELFSGNLLKPESLNTMLSWSNIDEGEVEVGDQYGLGVYEEQTPWGEMLGHDGGTLGYISRMRYFPETDTTVVILTNQRSNSVVSSIDSIFSAVSNTLFPDSENIITSKELVDSLDDNFVDGLIDVIDGIKNEADLVNLLSDEKALANIEDNVNQEKFFQLVFNPNNAVSSRALFDFISFGGIVPEESNKMVGNGADNTLVGENRDDNLIGGAGNDLIFGQGGNDTISGGLGDDTLYGGAGKDVFILEENAGTDTIVDFKIGEDLIDVTDFNLDLDSDLDKVNFTQQGEDALISFNGLEILNLQGVDINDLNEDSFIIEDVSPTPDPLFGTVDDDVIEIESGNQLVFAGKGDDLIDASNSSKNRIYAGADNDTLILGENSRLFGDAGDDRFFATSGGDNIITGGAGADQFWIAVASTPDTANTITDFTDGEDVIGIAGLGIGFADVDITQQDEDSLISLSGGNIAVLQGINADSLSVDNFTFAG